MPRRKIAWFFLIICGIFITDLRAHPGKVRTGAEVLLEKYLYLLQGKRVGIICNHTSVLPNKIRLVDTLLSKGVNVTTLFSPEHGLRGMVPFGEKVLDTVDEKTGLPVASLYRSRASTKMFENIDVFVFDIQDVGARFYSYYITMADAIEIAKTNNKVFIILDRPNPINGIDIEGPVLDSTLQSGVGRFSLPIRHGLTLGEMAKMIVGEVWIPVDSTFKLIVIPMEGWQRPMFYDETELLWIAPSPNMKFLSTAIVYPGMCLFEGTNLSEGRGAFKPFEYIGAPWLEGMRLARRLNSMQIPGAKFHAIKFTPISDSIRAPNPKYKGESCSGVFLQVTNRTTFRPVISALEIISVIRSLYPSHFEFFPRLFDQLAGSTSVRTGLEKNVPVDSLTVLQAGKTETFRTSRAKYLLY